MDMGWESVCAGTAKLPGRKIVINRLEDLNVILESEILKALQDRQKVPVGKKLEADFDS